MRSVQKHNIVVAALMLMLGSAAPAYSAPAIAVGPNTQVSTQRPHDDHSEVMIDADPQNPNNLIACSYFMVKGPGYENTVTYLSTDAGNSWHQVLTVGDLDRASGDPVCAFGFNHEIFALSIGSDLSLYRSSDLGVHWSGPAKREFIDREFLTIDRTGGKYKGRIYIHGTGSYPTLDAPKTDLATATVLRSTDVGRTLSEPVSTLAGPNRWLIGASNGVVLADGTFAFAFPEYKAHDVPNYGPEPTVWLKWVSSGDGGVHLTPGKLMTEYKFCQGGLLGGGRFHPTLALDETKGPFSNRIYAAFPEDTDGRCAIAVLHSTDAGKTWSQPAIVDRELTLNANGDGPNSSLPMIAVNRNGVVGVTWHDRRDDPKNLTRTLRFAASIDGGITFTPSVPVSTAVNVPKLLTPAILPEVSTTRLADGTLNTRFDPSFQDLEGGDTSGLVADANGLFHALWPDNRSGIGQLYTAAISVEGGALRNGDAALEKYTDVTDKVSIDFNRLHYDELAHTLAVDATLTNTSSTTLHGPLAVRAIRLDSEWADVAAVTTDNGQTQQGVIWRFELNNNSQTLAPKAKTAAKHLVFQVLNTRPVSNAALEKEPTSGLLGFQLRVLAQ